MTFDSPNFPHAEHTAFATDPDYGGPRCCERFNIAPPERLETIQTLLRRLEIEAGLAHAASDPNPDTNMTWEDVLGWLDEIKGFVDDEYERSTDAEAA